MTTETEIYSGTGSCRSFDDNASFNVRMIDCVGYIVPSSLLYVEMTHRAHGDDLTV